MRIPAFFSILCFSACFSQQVPDIRLMDAKLVKLSSLIKDQPTYQNQIVRVRAKYRSAFEVSTIWDTATKDLIWASFDEHLADNTRPEIIKRLDRLFAKNITVTVTVVGFLLPPNKLHEVNGQKHRFGFGHLSSWDFEFHILAVESVQ